MYDDDSDDGSPPLSMVKERGGRMGSPVQSMVEEYYEQSEVGDYMEEAPAVSVDGYGRMRRELSMVEEERSMDEEEERTRGGGNPFDSANFVNGSAAMDRINDLEMERRRDHIFIQDDPRFNNTHHSKENSWEPSPYHSMMEEKNEKSGRAIPRTLVPHQQNMDTSKTKQSSKSVKFAEKPDTMTLPVTASSSSTSTLVPSDERLPMMEEKARGDAISSPPFPSRLPSSSSTLPASPAESNMSGSVFVSTPNERLSSKQIRRSLRTRFSDISAVEDTETGNGSGRISCNEFLPTVQQAKQSPLAARPSSIPSSIGKDPSSESSLSVSAVLNVVKGAKSSQAEELLLSLEHARNQSRMRKRPDFGTSRGERSGVSSVPSSSAYLPSLPSLTASSRPPTSSSAPLSAPTIGREREREEREEYGRRREEPAGLPPRHPFRQMQTGEGERRKNDSVHSTHSRRDGMEGEGAGGEERPESVASTMSSMSGVSRKSSVNGHKGLAGLRELEFGYVSVGTNKIMIYKATNKEQFPLTCQYSLKSEGKRRNEEGVKREPAFKILDGSVSMIPANGTLEIRIQFTPRSVASFSDRLNIVVTGGGTNNTYGIPLFGLGGVSHVLVQPRSGLYPHRSSGDFVLHTSSHTQISLGIENSGYRAAFVRAVVVDRHCKKLEGVKFTPANSLVITAKTSVALRVDVSGARLDEEGWRRSSSSMGSNDGMGSRRSSTSSLNSIGSSSSSVAFRNSVSYSVLLYWGEETQRQRMVGACKAVGHTQFPPLCPIEEDFSSPFHDEQPFHPPKDRPLKRGDVDYFTAALRVTRVHVSLPSSSSSSSLVVLDESDGDRTLVPDDTFRGNDTMVSMQADMTAMKIRR